MRGITPNDTIRGTAGKHVLIRLPRGGAVLVTVADFERHGLGGYRWYLGARGRVVASTGAERSTLYLGRLLTGARAGQRVSYGRPPALAEVRGRFLEVWDYTPENIRAR